MFNFHMHYSVRQRALLAAITMALSVAPWLGVVAGDCPLESYICPNLDKSQTVTMQIPDLLGNRSGPEVTFFEHCVPLKTKSINSTKKGDKGFSAGTDHCGHWIIIAPNKPYDGVDNGDCGDFKKGPPCPAPTGF
jgi:hypothetical protein